MNLKYRAKEEGLRMKATSYHPTTIGALLCALGLVISLTGIVPSAYAVTLPSASVSDVSVSPNTVCGTNSTVTLSATVTGNFDGNSDVLSPNDPIGGGDTTGTGWGPITSTTSPCSQPVNQSRTVTETVTTYSKKLVIDGTDYPASLTSFTVSPPLYERLPGGKL